MPSLKDTTPLTKDQQIQQALQYCYERYTINGNKKKPIPADGKVVKFRVRK